ncbi:MAG: hypothetical protein KAK00_08625 [Nanoarchaeota archaeon]|nr:hypothetical protein [Nanoarchaeota archaeon]
MTCEVLTFGDIMPEEEFDDAITEDPDEQVDDDEMSPAEAGFARGAEEAGEKEKDKDSDEDEDEVR